MATVPAARPKLQLAKGALQNLQALASAGRATTILDTEEDQACIASQYCDIYLMRPNASRQFVLWYVLLALEDVKKRWACLDG